MATEACRKFIKNTGAPEELYNDKLSHYALIVIVVHCSYDNLRKFFVCIPAL